MLLDKKNEDDKLLIFATLIVAIILIISLRFVVSKAFWKTDCDNDNN